MVYRAGDKCPAGCGTKYCGRERTRRIGRAAGRAIDVKGRATVVHDGGGNSPVVMSTTSTADPKEAGALTSRTQIALHRPSFVVALVLVAFVTRAIAATAVHWVSIARGGNGFFFGDDFNYDQLAWQQAQFWRGVGPPVDSHSLHAYTYTEAAIYFVLGHHPLVMKLINCLLGALVVGLVFLLTRRYFGHQAAAFAGIAAAFFPSTFLWSLTNMRDTMFVFAVALLLWLLSVLLATGSWSLILPLLAAFALIGGIRFYIQAMLGLLIPGAILLQSRARWVQRWALAVVVGAGCAVLLWFSGGSQFFSVSPADVNQVRQCMAGEARSAYVPRDTAVAAGCWVSDSQEASLAERSIRDLIGWVPTGFAYALAAPFPWAVNRPIEFVTIPEMLIWYTAVVLAVIALACHWRQWRKFAHLLAFIGGIVLLLALTQGNEGTLVRHRGMIIPFVLIFSGAGAAWLWSLWCMRRVGLDDG